MACFLQAGAYKYKLISFSCKGFHARKPPMKGKTIILCPQTFSTVSRKGIPDTPQDYDYFNTRNSPA
jgi:hypothetical protein